MSIQRPQPPSKMRRGVEMGRLMEGKKDRRKEESNRILITVTVPGSAGLFRFVVREKELVEAVIGTVLKSYARQGRLPVLGSDLNEFVLYSAYDCSDALSPREPISSNRSRNFMLCKKQILIGNERPDLPARESGKKRKGGWKAWLNESLSFRISPR